MGKTTKKTTAQDKKTQIIVTALFLITLIAVAVTIWALFFRKTTPVLTPDYAPQETETHAEPIPGDSDNEKMETTSGGGAVSMVYQKEVQISLASQTASLMFQNPSKSVNDIVLQLVITAWEFKCAVGHDCTETVIAQSGTLQPGYKVETLDLIQGAASLSEGTYTGKFNVLYYDPDTGEKAVLNSTIEGVAITVAE